MSKNKIGTDYPRVESYWDEKTHQWDQYFARKAIEEFVGRSLTEKEWQEFEAHYTPRTHRRVLLTKFRDMAMI